MLLGQLQQRQQLAQLAERPLLPISMTNVKEALSNWLENMKDAEGSKQYGDQLKALLPNFSDNALLAEINAMSGLFTKKSYWVFLGDGAAYDIAYGGIDHVLAR
jgi:pyruvate-ferredoxin/flavodoxin oxidoreductase